MSVDNYLEMLQDIQREYRRIHNSCLLYTSDAADEL